MLPGNSNQTSPHSYSFSAVAFSYIVIVSISQISSFFFIYLIITKSTKEIQIYKYFLLKLAICNALFNMSISMLVTPDLLCPLSAAAVRSPIGSLSETHATFAVGLTACLAATVFLSINDCAFLRICIFYQWTFLVKKIASWSGVCFFIILNIIVASALVCCLCLVSPSNEEFLKYVHTSNLSSILGPYAEKPNTTYFYVDMADSPFAPLMTTSVGLLLFFHCLNLLASRIVLQKIGNRKRNMSYKSYQIHRKLSKCVLFQNTFPAIAAILPLLLVFLSLAFRYKSDACAGFVKHFVTLFVAIYPTISVFSSIISVDSYRNFFLSLVCTARKKYSGRVFVLGAMEPNSQRDSVCAYQMSFDGVR